MYSCMRERPTVTPTSAHTVLTELVNAVVRSIVPKARLPKLLSGTPETTFCAGASTVLEAS